MTLQFQGRYVRFVTVSIPYNFTLTSNLQAIYLIVHIFIWQIDGILSKVAEHFRE